MKTQTKNSTWFFYLIQKELSALSEQIEDAESFELLIDTGASKPEKKKEKPETSKMAEKEDAKKIHLLEEQIREQVKQIEDKKKMWVFLKGFVDVDQ